MKISLLVLTVAVLGFLAVVSVSAAKPHWHELDEDYTFEQYTKDFFKRYASAEEHAARKALFERKLKDIVRFNKEDHSWKKGVNHLTDKFDHELKRLRGVKKELLYANHEERIARPVPEALTRPVEYLPDYIDWREKNVISDVKDQGDCGSCWTFATAESVESYWAIAHGILPVLSEQQVLDCTPNPQQCGGTGGCAGGTTEIAFTQILKIGGLSSEWTYPYMSYHGRNFNCSFNSTLTPPAANITGYVGLPSNQYDPIMNAVVNGPLAISVDASSWSDYETGVYNGCNNTNPDIDHAVQLVGYGTDSVLGDYWLVRNSWSPAWGENGYIRIGRSSNVTCGTDLNPSDGTACAGGPPTVTVCGNCGILYDVTYPTVN